MSFCEITGLFLRLDNEESYNILIFRLCTLYYLRTKCHDSENYFKGSVNNVAKANTQGDPDYSREGNCGTNGCGARYQMVVLKTLHSSSDLHMLAGVLSWLSILNHLPKFC